MTIVDHDECPQELMDNFPADFVMREIWTGVSDEFDGIFERGFVWLKEDENGRSESEQVFFVRVGSAEEARKLKAR